MITMNLAMESESGCIVNSLPGFVWTAFPDGQIDFLSLSWPEYTGLGIEESCGRRWQTAVHPEDLPRLLSAWRSDVAANTLVEAEIRVRRSDGIYRWFLFRANPSAFDAGRVVKWCGLITDIDERVQVQERNEALLSGEKRLLELIARGRPMSDVLESLCRLVESTASGLYCSIVLLDQIGRKVERAIAPSLPTEFNDSLSGLPLHRIGGPCVMAARDNIQVIVSDVVSDTRWHRGWRTLAQAHDLRSCWSTPIISEAEKVLGTFALYQRQPGRPNLSQLNLIQEFTRVAGIAIERARYDAALRQSEAGLAEAERELQLTIDTMPMLVATYRPDGTRVFVNQTWSDYTGLSRERAISVEDASIIHPEDAGRVFREWQKSLAAGVPFKAEMRLRRADGEYRWHSTYRVLAFDELGDVARWYSIGIDIEDRKQADEALRRSQAFLAKAQQLSLTGSFLFYSATEEFTWSEQLYRIFEFEPDVRVTLALIGSRYHPEDRHVVDEVAAGIRRGEPDLDYDHRLLMPDGSIKHVRVVAHGTPDKEGRGLEYFGAVQDLTQRRVAEAALDKARSELAHVSRVMTLGVMTASIAHEVNQPLAGILTNANTCLRMLNADPPNVYGACETTLRAIRDANRAAEIISRLRSLFAKRERSSELVNLNEASREVISLSMAELQKNRVILQSEFANDLPPIRGDRVQLQQVMLNMIRNAAEAMNDVDDRPRQLVFKTTKLDPEAVLLSVQDSGSGIDPSNLDRLFEAFYTTKADGLGIGLSICRTIVEAHGGKLWATAAHPRGAIFQFTLPVAVDNANSD